MQCFTENGAPDNVVYSVEINDSGIYNVRCRNGHDVTVVVQELKFELLAEYACNAILDGYYREAVASFAASMERFYEFYIRVRFEAKKKDPIQFEAAWKEMSKQSERQLGAFIAIYALQEKNEPVLLGRKHIEFRNDVIHKGIIPKREEAINFGQAVVDTIYPTLMILKKNHADAMTKVVNARVIELARRSSSEHRSHMSYPTILSRSNDKLPALTEWIESINKRRSTQGW
jgi:hypothetical protein